MRLSTIVLLCVLLAPASAFADAYRVDLIVFLDKTESPAEFGRSVQVPDTARTLDPANAAALKSNGIEILPDDQFALTDSWQRLKTAKRYQPLIRLAWLQKNPPAERSVALRLKWGDGLSVNHGEGRGASLVHPVDGSVALLLGNYLNLDVDLAYTQRGTDAAPSTWRLREKRRMKRDELHHLDSPKLGVIARIVRAAPPG